MGGVEPWTFSVVIRDLAILVRGGASLANLKRGDAIIGLARARAGARVSDDIDALASAARSLVSEAVDLLPPPQQTQARILLGLDLSEGMNLPAELRRDRAAVYCQRQRGSRGRNDGQDGVEAETFRRHREKDLLAEISDRLFQVANSENVGPASGRPPPAEQVLANAILLWADDLYSQNRYRSLLDLRNNVSMTLHILGFHDARWRLGQMAFQAATLLEDDLAKSHVLIDDLGWAAFLLDKEADALQSIRRGIDVARAARLRAPSRPTSLTLLEAKGLRHLALIGCRTDARDAERHLNEALSLLSALDQSDLEVRRDIAQIWHAEALAVATRHGVQRGGLVGAGHRSANDDVRQAIAKLRTAADEFRSIDDQVRYTKALFLLVRLLEAVDATQEAREGRILLDRALASSAWTTPQAIEGTIGAMT